MSQQNIVHVFRELCFGCVVACVATFLHHDLFFMFVVTNEINVATKLSQRHFIYVAIGFAFCLGLCCNIVSMPAPLTFEMFVAT